MRVRKLKGKVFLSFVVFTQRQDAIKKTPALKPSPLPKGEGDRSLKLHSKNKPRLQLKHTRRIDVGERGDCIRRRADASHELAERGCRCGCIAVGGHSPTQHIRV